MKMALAVLTALSCSLSAYAAEPASKKKAAPAATLAAEPDEELVLPTSKKADSDVDYVISKKNVVEENSSAHHRIDQKFQLNAILFGIGPSISVTNGLQFGYFLNRNQLVLLEATRGEIATWYSSIDSLTGYSLDVETKSLGAHFKHFTGNSFYYRVGADYRTVDYSYSYRTNVSDNGRFKGSSFAANLQIGNQWQWSHFTLGCDWIGVTVPLTSSIKDRYVSSSTSYDQTQVDDDSKLLVKDVHLNLLRFYLGASF